MFGCNDPEASLRLNREAGRMRNVPKVLFKLYYYLKKFHSRFVEATPGASQNIEITIPFKYSVLRELFDSPSATNF